jgi:amidase
MNLARKLRDEYDAVLEQYDAVIMPTLPQPARRHIPRDATPLQWASHARE